MTNRITYSQKYENSWAIVIGINDYKHASPLTYACNDANAVAAKLIDSFNFPNDNVMVLLDNQATQKAVTASILGLVDTVGEDDRIIVFYAGHGYTRAGRRGEVGYLVPCDGNTNDLASLIRWDELTRNSDLIPAKHMLFIMDACYGGLAVTRALPPGSARFVGDMLSRYSRQVLTAGKADEVVADSGGPRAGNSVFTGHFLEALDGASASVDGVVSANSVMAYVYDRVAKDPNSHQSPHYGFLDGDGDLMFLFADLQVAEGEEPKDVLMQVPANLQVLPEATETDPLLDTVKECLSDNKHRIRLDDILTRELRASRQHFAESEFPLQTETVTVEDIAGRLNKYEDGLANLLSVMVLIGRWADNKQLSAIERIIGGFSEINEAQSGRSAWLGLRSYPMMLLIYGGGIAAINGSNYQGLSTLFSTPVYDRQSENRNRTAPALVATVNAILNVERLDLFKKLPGHERNYAARSEYVFKRLQSTLEDVLFLGSRYEDLFDRFEILYALSYADLNERLTWAPLGRFAWKYCHDAKGSPYLNLVQEAQREKDRWPPLEAGMFQGSYSRFEEVAKRFQTGMLDKLQWY